MSNQVPNEAKVFFFKGLRVEGAKVSHNFAVGLPSLTGLTGLASAFAAKLAQSYDLEPTELVSSGVLFAFENYQLSEGYKKGFKTGKVDYERVPSAWASFTAHLAFEVKAATAKAQSLLDGEDLSETAQELLESLSFCKGRFQNVFKPVNLGTARLKDFAGDRQRAIAMLPSFSTVVTEAGFVVEDLRAAGLPLMEGLMAATLSHDNRPSVFKEFYEEPEHGGGRWKLAPVQDGYLVIDAKGVGQSLRPTYAGVQAESHVASPTLSLVRLQSAASLKLDVAQTSQQTDADRVGPFWVARATQHSFYCAT
jgi:hypothetical protein